MPLFASKPEKIQVTATVLESVSWRVKNGQVILETNSLHSMVYYLDINLNSIVIIAKY